MLSCDDVWRSDEGLEIRGNQVWMRRKIVERLHFEENDPERSFINEVGEKEINFQFRIPETLKRLESFKALRNNHLKKNHSLETNFGHLPRTTQQLPLCPLP